jgi:hypothetical protein
MFLKSSKQPKAFDYTPRYTTVAEKSEPKSLRSTWQDVKAKQQNRQTARKKSSQTLYVLLFFAFILTYALFKKLNIF